MRKLSKAQEMVLRQVAAGQVKLVFIGSNEDSVRRWNAVGKGGRKINPTYDVLAKAGLIVAPLSSGDMMWVERKVFLSIIGEDAIIALGPAGTLIISDFAPGTGDSWSIRLEKGEDQPFVLYLNGTLYARYSTQDSIYTVYRHHVPYVRDNLEASLSR